MSKKPRRVRGIESRRRADGTWTHGVRYEDPASGKRRREEFDDIDDAVYFKEELRRAKKAGRVADLTRGQERLCDFVVDDYWPNYATVELQPNTLKGYESVWRLHVEPRVGHLELRQIDAEIGAKLRRALEDDGVGAPTIVRALTFLQSVFARAVLWGRRLENPFLSVPKPTVVARAVQPLRPVAIESIREHLDADGRIIADLIGYEGHRPEEALALQFKHFRTSTILVEQVNVDGEIRPGTKVKGKDHRIQTLYDEVARDVAEHRRRGGVVRHDEAYVIARADGRPWRETDYRNWRRRIWQPAAAAAGVATLDVEVYRDERGRRKERRRYDGPPPYWMRHGAVTVRILAGVPYREISDELGHDVKTLIDHYDHFTQDQRGAARIPVPQQIAEARRQLLAA